MFGFDISNGQTRDHLPDIQDHTIKQPLLTSATLVWNVVIHFGRDLRISSGF